MIHLRICGWQEEAGEVVLLMNSNNNDNYSNDNNNVDNIIKLIIQVKKWRVEGRVNQSVSALEVNDAGKV